MNLHPWLIALGSCSFDFKKISRRIVLSRVGARRCLSPAVFVILSVSFLAALFSASSYAKPSKGRAAAEKKSLLRSPTLSQPDDGSGIKSIAIRGNKKIEADAIIAKLKSKVGDSLSKERIAEDIRALHNLGYFDDIQADYSDRVLTFIVKEHPTVVKIDFEGNDQIASKDLKEVIKLKEYAILDITKVKEDVAAIQKHYEDKGFYLARVSYDVQKSDKKDEVNLIYRVNDFEKVRIKKITFLNNKKFSDQKLKDIMRSTKEGSFFSWLTSSGSFKESAFKQDLQMIRYFYANEGYVKAQVDTPVVTVSEDKKSLFISIRIEEGEQYKVGDIDFGGDLLFTKDELSKDLHLIKGETFSISGRNDDIQLLTEKYQDLGYAFVNVNPRANIRDDEKVVDIRYDFEKGELAHFGQINILGNAKTRDKVIRRELRVHEGELYNGSRLRISKERVERLGFFGQGEVVVNSVTRKDNPSIVDLEISIKERSTGTVSLGMGYGSLQGFFMTTTVAENNLFGRGQNLSLQGQYSANRLSRSLSISFTEPYFLDTLWSAGTDIFYVVSPIPNRYLTLRSGGAVRFGYPIVDDLYISNTYKFEHLRLDDIQLARDPELNFSDDIGNLSSMQLGLAYDRRNNRFETTKGYYSAATGELGGLGANKHFAKLLGDVRFYHPIAWGLVFRTKAELGHIFQTREDKNIPPAEKFYLGGPNNLKGYNQLSVSPRSRFGSPLGAKSQWNYIAEVEMPLVKEAGLKFVTFFDAGSATSSFNDLFASTEIRKDVGFGLRWFSPIGPLRFEWGFPLNPRPFDDPYVFQFFIGPPF